MCASGDVFCELDCDIKDVFNVSLCRVEWVMLCDVLPNQATAQEQGTTEREHGGGNKREERSEEHGLSFFYFFYVSIRFGWGFVCLTFEGFMVSTCRRSRKPTVLTRV